MLGYKCKDCNRSYIPIFQDFPPPNECNCGGKTLIPFLILELNARCPNCGKDGPAGIIENKSDDKTNDAVIHRYYVICCNCGHYFDWNAPEPIKVEWSSVTVDGKYGEATHTIGLDIKDGTDPVICPGFVTPPKREGLYCTTCKAKTPHHYIMLGPTGVMSCNVCGTDYNPEDGPE